MLVAALILLTSLRAGAQPAREQAARLGARAQEACLSGQHEEALRLYEEAFRLRPQPRRDYYAGIEQQHLDRPVEAVEALERYLEVAGGEPEFVADAVSRRNELRSRLGEIELVTSERDVAVLVDGQRRSPSSSGRIKVKVGLRRVVVKKPGFHPFEATAQVSPGGRTVVSAQMRSDDAEALREEPLPLRLESSVEPRRNTELTLLAGAGLWRDVAESPGTVAFLAGASHHLVGDQLELRAAVRATVDTVTKNHNLALGLLAAPVLRYAGSDQGLAVSLEVGLGTMVLFGLERGSPLLEKNIEQVTGPISCLALRPALTLDVPLSPSLALVGSLAAAWSPAPSQHFVSRSLTRFDVGFGLSFRF